MALSYSFRLAIQSILHEKWINLLSILTIAAGLLFTAITILSIYNIDLATRKLPEKFSVMLYLGENISPQEIEQIMNTARKDSAVESAKFIPRDEALRELRKTLKDTAFLLEGLGENPLPDSVEIKFKSDAVGPETVRKIAAKLREFRGVYEIEYGEKFLSSIYSLRVGMRTVGIMIVIVMSAGMLFVCYSTVKILFYRKEREIETYKLLGATKGFIRMPFLIEGGVIGLSGGFLSFFAMLALYYFVVLRLSLSFPLFRFIVFPIDLSLAIPLSGLFLGITGAAIAIGRIRY